MLQTIKSGDSCREVTVAKLLTGYAQTATLDEVFGDAFAEWVQTWQSERGCDPDGQVGPETWRAIAAAAPVVSTAKNRKSDAAKAAQLLLGVAADGIYGPNSKAACAAYQAGQGLTADGICGGKTWAALITGEAEQVNPDAVQPENFKQYDSRWGAKMYSNHGDKKQTMRSSGCGPTSMADIVKAWWDADVTPYTLAQLSMEWGTRTYNSGTSSTFFRKIAEKYKPSKYVSTSNIETAISCLNAGGYVVACFGKSKWTSGGHYCCLWKWDGTYFYVNDPASAKAERAKGTKAEVKNARKGFYCFWR